MSFLISGLLSKVVGDGLPFHLEQRVPCFDRKSIWTLHQGTRKVALACGSWRLGGWEGLEAGPMDVSTDLLDLDLSGDNYLGGQRTGLRIRL